jgi:Flp pilus assembly pilin Flp
MLDRLNMLVVAAHTRLATLDLRREEGQALTEYALVLGVIVLAVVVALTTIGTTIHAKIQLVCQAIAGQSANCP